MITGSEGGGAVEEGGVDVGAEEELAVEGAEDWGVNEMLLVPVPQYFPF